jgi:two-component system KDP operon response regulator KdpE
LVVDDELAIRRLLRITLGARGYEVSEATTAEEARREAAQFRPDLILLDLGLPDGDGKELLRDLREWSKVPILVLTARDREAEKIEALDSGADDYVTKPFSPEELMARMRAAIRRFAPGENSPILRCGDLTMDLAAHRALRGEEELHLTPTEYELLKNLFLNAGKVVTHRQLLRAVWGGIGEDTHTVRVYVAQLRRKIEENPGRPRRLLTESGVGYRLAEPRDPA